MLHPPLRAAAEQLQERTCVDEQEPRNEEPADGAPWDEQMQPRIDGRALQRAPTKLGRPFAPPQHRRSPVPVPPDPVLGTPDLGPEEAPAMGAACPVTPRLRA